MKTSPTCAVQPSTDHHAKRQCPDEPVPPKPTAHRSRVDGLRRSSHDPGPWTTTKWCRSRVRCISPLNQFVQFVLVCGSCADILVCAASGLWRRPDQKEARHAPQPLPYRLLYVHRLHDPFPGYRLPSAHSTPSLTVRSRICEPVQIAHDCRRGGHDDRPCRIPWRSMADQISSCSRASQRPRSMKAHCTSRKDQQRRPRNRSR